MDFTSFLIIDVRAALWEKVSDIPAGQTEEIISVEIASIDTNKNQIVEHESILVKPVKAKISKYCEENIGISQADVDKKGIPFCEVYRKLRVHYMSRDRFWGTWGSYDKYMIEQQCKQLELENPFKLAYYDIQKLYSMMIGLDNENQFITTDQALRYSGEQSDNNKAVNIAHLFMRMGKGLRQQQKITRIITPSSFHRPSGTCN